MVGPPWEDRETPAWRREPLTAPALCDPVPCRIARVEPIAIAIREACTYEQAHPSARPPALRPVDRLDHGRRRARQHLAAAAARPGRHHRGQLDPFALQPLPRQLEPGRRSLFRMGRHRVRDAGDRGQQREGHRRHQGADRPDRRQHGAERRSQREPGRAPDRRGLRRGRRLRHDAMEQARRPAPLGLRSLLCLPHLVRRQAERQGDGRGAVPGDGRLGGYRGARRHPLERAGDRAQGRPRRGARREPGRRASGFPGGELGPEPGLRHHQRLGDALRRRHQRHLGRQRRHGHRSARGAARRGHGGDGAGHRHRRHPARGRGRDGRRVRRHRRLGPVLAGRHGPLDPLPRQDRQVRSVGRAAGASRVLRHAAS